MLICLSSKVIFFPFFFVFLLPYLLYIACHKGSWSLVFATSMVCASSDLLTSGHQVGPRTPDLGPDVGFIHILHFCCLVVSFISVDSTISVVVSSHVVFGLDLMVLGLAVFLVSLAAMVLSLRSIYLTPNPNPRGSRDCPGYLSP